MDKIEKAKEIIKENFENAQCGLFDTRNTVGDEMTNIYNENGLIIDICYYWRYFKVFGLSDAEFSELYEYYVSLGGF